jgi:uncharacterized membrane protein
MLTGDPAETLHGSVLVAGWALETAALSQLAGRTRGYGALGFLALAVVHALIAEAPPIALLTGVSSLRSAAVALAAITVAMLRAGQTQAEGTKSRRWLLGGAAAALLSRLGRDHTPRSNLVGLVGLIAGLRRNNPALRNAALGLLLMTVGKVFLYDLSTLTSLYRVISFMALGLLLLTAAFAYQRLRPPPAPDMRTLHPSQR